MSRSPTTPDKRVGYKDSRPASGWPTYQSKEEPRGKGPGTSDGMPQRSLSGTGPNPNMTYASGGGTYDVYADRHTGGQGDSGGFSQDDNDLQCLGCHQPLARPTG